MISRGLCADSWPNSLANVSPAQQAKYTRTPVCHSAIGVCTTQSTAGTAAVAITCRAPRPTFASSSCDTNAGADAPAPVVPSCLTERPLLPPPLAAECLEAVTRALNLVASDPVTKKRKSIAAQSHPASAMASPAGTAVAAPRGVSHRRQTPRHATATLTASAVATAGIAVGCLGHKRATSERQGRHCPGGLEWCCVW